MAQTVDLLVTGGEVVSSTGRRRADVAVHDGLIVEVAPDLSSVTAARRIDAGGCSVLPGLFDAHNHPYYDEDLEHFSRAAAYGGITTLLSFVAGRPGAGGGRQDIVEAGAAFVEEVRSASYLDCGGHAILSGDDLHGSVPRLRDLGYGSFKVFTAFPGMRMLTDDQIYVAMRQIADAGGLCMVHCENGPVTDLLERELRAEGSLGGASYLASRPVELENEAVYRALSFATLARCPAYIVHISSEESLRIVEDFRRRGEIPVYAETCLHYLRLTGQEQAELGPRAKISPPCRSAQDRERLWDRVRAGDVDVIATDGSGQLLAKKEASGDDYLAAPYGIPGVEEIVRILAAAAGERGIDPVSLLVRTMAERPASIFGLGTTKGSVEVGKDGDLAIFDPDREWTVRAAEQHGRSDYSLYEGQSGRGCVVWTCQRGRPVLADGEVEVTPGAARFLPTSPVTATTARQK